MIELKEYVGFEADLEEACKPKKKKKEKASEASKKAPKKKKKKGC